MDKTPRAVTVLGLGRMGSALAGAMARSGHTVTVWNRTAGRAMPLRSLGVVVADTVAGACASSDVVVVSVNDYDTTRELLDDDAVASALRGRVMVQLSSGTPSQARELAGWAAEHEVDYIDGNIVGYPSAIGTPDAVIFYAGPAAAFEAAKPLLADLSGDPVYVGDDPGHPATIDGALIMNVMSIYVASMVGRAMCEAEGIAPDAWGFFSGLMLGAAPTLVGELNTLLERNDFSGDEASLTTWAHGADLIRDGLAERGVDTTLAACIAGLAHRAIERGHGDDGFAAIYDVVAPGGS
jgi:3-hydroxyisobutyrate dehydrogenase-like beta-hydroxyacid dehydrogenase